MPYSANTQKFYNIKQFIDSEYDAYVQENPDNTVSKEDAITYLLNSPESEDFRNDIKQSAGLAIDDKLPTAQEYLGLDKDFAAQEQLRQTSGQPTVEERFKTKERPPIKTSSAYPISSPISSILEAAPEAIARGAEDIKDFVTGFNVEGTASKTAAEILKNLYGLVVSTAELSANQLEQVSNNLQLLINLPAASFGGEQEKKNIAEAVTKAIKLKTKETKPIGTEARAAVEDTVGEAVELIDNAVRKTSFGKAVSDAVKGTVDPILTPGEDIVSTLGEYASAYRTVSGLARPSMTQVGTAQRAATTFADTLKNRRKAAIDKELRTRGQNPQPFLKPPKPSVGILPKSIAADMYMLEEDETVLPSLLLDEEDQLVFEWLKNTDAKTNGAISSALKALEINPMDSQATQLIKKFADATAFNTAAIGPFLTLEKIINVGNKVKNSAKQIKAGALKKPNDSKTATSTVEKVEEYKPVKTTESVAEESAWKTDKAALEKPTVAKPKKEQPKEYVQQNAVTRLIGRVNTRLGRMLRPSAALPEEVAELYTRQERFARALEPRIARITTQVEEARKLTVKAGLNERLVNEALRGNMEVIRYLPKAAADKILAAKKAIDANESLIKKILKIPESEKISFGVAKDGTYITRAYKTFIDPTWSKKIAQALKGKLKTTDIIGRSIDNNVEIIEIVNKARNFFKDMDRSLTDNEIDTIIRGIVRTTDTGKPVMNIFDTFDDLLSSNTKLTPQRIKSLKKRKELPETYMSLLGEIKDPVANTLVTLRSQSNVIAKARFLNGLKKFAAENVGKNVKLPGLIKGLPSETTTFYKPTSQVSKGITLDKPITANLGEIAAKELGALGGKGRLGLDQFFTTPKTLKFIDEGFNVYQPDVLYQALGKAISITGIPEQVATKYLRKGVGIGQAFQTVYDTTAHKINLIGMGVSMVNNGYMFNMITRPLDVLRTLKMFGDDLLKTKNPESIRLFEHARTTGILDDNITIQGMLENLTAYEKSLNKQKTILEKTGSILSAPFKLPIKLYSFTDDFGKMYGFLQEYKAYSKAYKGVKTDQQILDLASKTIRQTLPSYSGTAPIIRGLAKVPFIGTYASHPFESIRTFTNSATIGFNDFVDGVRLMATDPVRGANLAATGARRLAGVGVTVYGMDKIYFDNKMENFISETTDRSIRLLKGFNYYGGMVYDGPLQEEEDGEIYSRIIETGNADSYDYQKVIYRAIQEAVDNGFGLTEEGQRLTNFEIGKAASKAIEGIFGTYYGEKAGWKVLSSLAKNEVESISGQRKVIYDPNLSLEDKVDRIKDFIFRNFVPGALQNWDKEIEAKESEKKVGRGKGINKFGFPLRLDDVRQRNATGMPTNTIAVKKGTGSILYSLYSEIENFEKQFKEKLKGTSIAFTPEEEQEILDFIPRWYAKKAELQGKIRDATMTFSNIQYIDKKGNLKTFGLDGVVNATVGVAGEYGANKKVVKDKITKYVMGNTLEGGGVGDFAMPYDDDSFKRDLLFLTQSKRGISPEFQQRLTEALYGEEAIKSLTLPKPRGLFETYDEDKQMFITRNVFGEEVEKRKREEPSEAYEVIKDLAARIKGKLM